DAISGAAKYLVAHGAQNNVSGAIFAYNHLTSYVQSVLHWAAVYANGGFSVSAASSGGTVTAPQCLARAARAGPWHAPAPHPGRSRWAVARAARGPRAGRSRRGSRSPGHRWASRTCLGAPGRTRSTAPG